MTQMPLAEKGETAEMPTRGFKKVVLSRKSDYIVEQIYEALLRGELKPEQRLSSESELADTFGVSKLTVREAVRTLEQMGIIEVRKGGSGGLFVREADLASTVRQLESIMRIPHITVSDLTETRVALEHLLEVRHAPVGRRAVPVEAAGGDVRQREHALQRPPNHLAEVLAPGEHVLLVLDGVGVEGHPAVLAHAEAAQREVSFDELAAELGREIGQPDVPVVALPPAIVTHGGPGLLAVGFFVE